MDHVRRRRDRLNDAGLVVGGLQGEHDPPPRRAGTFQRLAKRREIEPARGRQTDTLKLLGRETVSREDRRMFSGAGQEQIERPRLVAGCFDLRR